jgi:hypothetical protein
MTNSRDQLHTSLERYGMTPAEIIEAVPQIVSYFEPAPSSIPAPAEKPKPLTPAPIRLHNQPDIPLTDIVVCAQNTRGKRRANLMCVSQLVGISTKNMQRELKQEMSHLRVRCDEMRLQPMAVPIHRFKGRQIWLLFASERHANLELDAKLTRRRVRQVRKLVDHVLLGGPMPQSRFTSHVEIWRAIGNMHNHRFFGGKSWRRELWQGRGSCADRLSVCYGDQYFITDYAKLRIVFRGRAIELRAQKSAGKEWADNVG